MQDAIRSLLAKMGVEVVELPDAREQSHFCGESFLKAAPKMDAGFAPWRYVKNARERGIFEPHEPDEIDRLLAEHCAAIEPDEVCCYCTACDTGLERGGKKVVNIIELVSGQFRDR